MQKFKLIHALLFIFYLTVFSCDRIKNKTYKAIDKTKYVIEEKKSDVTDKIIPHYDPYHPDTKFNKKRFSEFFMFEPTQDVKNIYSYADEIGIDHKYQFAFNCNPATIDRIVINLKLNKGVIQNNNGSGLWGKFPWWDSLKVESLKPFSRKGAHDLLVSMV